MKGRMNTIFFQLSIGFILLSWMREDGEDERKMKERMQRIHGNEGVSIYSQNISTSIIISKRI